MTDARPADIRACAVVSLFRFSVRARTWHRLPVFSIGARYQPGAARQKGAISPTTAPFRTPEVVAPSALKRFDPPLSSVLVSSHHRKQIAVSRRHTHGQPLITTPFKHENVIKLAGVLGVAPELRLTANGNAV